MARTTVQPTRTTRRRTTETKPETNGLGSLTEQDRRDEGSRHDNDDRDDGLSAVHSEQDNDRDGSRDERGFGGNDDRDERTDERTENSEYGDNRAGREQRPAVMAGMDTFAPVLTAWKQVFASWTELTETMVKVQQETFASMISAANAHAKDLDLGENHNGTSRNGEHAVSASNTTASTPERIDRDRR